MKLYFFFVFLFHVLFSLFVAVVIAIFYCFNYTSLLLHWITTLLISHLTLSSIISIISTLIIGIFYCLTYASLLLHLIITHLVNTFYNNQVINIFLQIVCLRLYNQFFIEKNMCKRFSVIGNLILRISYDASHINKT